MTNCRTIEPRPPPIASLITISLRRVAPRASIMFARLSEAIDSATAAVNINSVMGTSIAVRSLSIEGFAENGIDQTEDRGVGADAKNEHKCRKRAEHGIFIYSRGALQVMEQLFNGHPGIREIAPLPAQGVLRRFSLRGIDAFGA